MRWQRAVDAALRPLGLTHTQYLVLASAAAAISEQGDDAVPQHAIAESAELDRVTTSVLVRKLEARGLLDRGNDATDGRKWRVMLTQRGQSTLKKASLLVEAIAADVVPRRH